MTIRTVGRFWKNYCMVGTHAYFTERLGMTGRQILVKHRKECCYGLDMV
jgi:hypothetical protein